MSLDNKFDQILKNYNDIETKLSSGSLDSKQFAQLSKEFSELTPLANKIKRVEIKKHIYIYIKKMKTITQNRGP